MLASGEKSSSSGVKIDWLINPVTFAGDYSPGTGDGMSRLKVCPPKSNVFFQCHVPTVPLKFLELISIDKKHRLIHSILDKRHKKTQIPKKGNLRSTFCSAGET